MVYKCNRITDYLGNVRAVVRDDGAVVEENDYYPYGLLYPDKPNATGIGTRIQPYTTTGKELDTHYSLNWLNFGSRQYMPDLGQWNRVDDLCEKYYPTGPYVYCGANPVKYIDPNGMLYKEYDQYGNLLSNLGGNKFDFQHTAKHNTIVTDKTTGKKSIINNGESLIRGYVHRDASATVAQLTKEFLTETGPTKSLFADFADSKWGPFSSLESSYSTYTSEARHSSIVNAEDKKGIIAVNTLLANPFSAGIDMWEQFIGGATISWYDLGDDIMYLLYDSKSNSSFLYHMSPYPNRERNSNSGGWGNTYQTYIWTETKGQRDARYEAMWRKIINMNKGYK